MLNVCNRADRRLRDANRAIGDDRPESPKKIAVELERLLVHLLLAGQAVQNEALLLALDTADSAQVLQMRGATLEVLGSFVAQTGKPCRAFTRLRESTETLALACRDEAGAWTVAFAAEGSARTDDPGYRTASDERTAEADAFLREVLRATALDAAEERALIERGWAR